MREILLPATEPETEWVDGRALQKVSPTRSHARLQRAFLFAFAAWEERRGQSAPEWRFRIAPPGEARRPLVPDVAFVSYERMRGFAVDELDAPPFAPDVAIEVLSPDDRSRDLRAKLDVYLRSGTRLVIVADPTDRTLVLHAPDETPRTLRPGDTFAHPAVAGLTFDVTEFFARALDVPASGEIAGHGHDSPED